MADAGFFKGTSADQDSRFANKQKKLLKQMKFPDNIAVKIDMLKINFDVLKPWITKRLQELLGIEDDVVIEFVFNQLEDKNPDPKMMQINLTGFLGGSKARLFIGELWSLLSSAQSSPDGIPAELVEMKKQELLKRQIEDDRLREIRKREEDSQRHDIKPVIEKSDERNQTYNKSQNGNTGGYKSRGYYDRDRRRSPQKTRRISPEPKSRRIEKKPQRSVSKSSESENDRPHRQEKSKKPVKSPSRSRSPIKSSRKPEKHQSRSSSSSSSSIISNASPKPKTRPIATDRSHKKVDKSSRKKTTSKQTRSSSSSSSEVELKKSKKKSPSPVRHKKKDEHKSKKHHRSNHSKEKPHRDYPDKSKTKKTHRNESSKKKNSNLSDNETLRLPSPARKPQLQSQIRVQTPPSDDQKSKPNRTERIVLLEESRSIPNSNDEQLKSNSEDENEIDLRERLLREKAIKSMKRRQLSTNNNNDRIVYETNN